MVQVVLSVVVPALQQEVDSYGFEICLASSTAGLWRKESSFQSGGLSMHKKI